MATSHASHKATPQAASSNPTVDRVRTLAEEVLSGRAALYLVDVVVRGRTGSQVVEVYVDGDESVPVDALAEVSRELSFLLDAEDVVRGKYNLHVSSPGADRPLSVARQYPKHVGRRLAVQLRPGSGEDLGARLTGTLAAAHADGITLAVEGQGPRQISFDEIDEAKVLLPW